MAAWVCPGRSALQSAEQWCQRRYGQRRMKLLRFFLRFLFRGSPVSSRHGRSAIFFLEAAWLNVFVVRFCQLRKGKRCYCLDIENQFKATAKNSKRHQPNHVADSQRVQGGQKRESREHAEWTASVHTLHMSKPECNPCSKWYGMYTGLQRHLTGSLKAGTLTEGFQVPSARASGAVS